MKQENYGRFTQGAWKFIKQIELDGEVRSVHVTKEEARSETELICGVNINCGKLSRNKIKTRSEGDKMVVREDDKIVVSDISFKYIFIGVLTYNLAIVFFMLLDNLDTIMLIGEPILKDTVISFRDYFTIGVIVALSIFLMGLFAFLLRFIHNSVETSYVLLLSYYMMFSLTILHTLISGFAKIAFIHGVTYANKIIIPTLADAYYFSIATFTTLGYGDFSPHEDLRLVFALEALMGYMFFALMMGTMIALILRDDDDTKEKVTESNNDETRDGDKEED